MQKFDMKERFNLKKVNDVEINSIRVEFQICLHLWITWVVVVVVVVM
jgi:hypothetical protein